MSWFGRLFGGQRQPAEGPDEALPEPTERDRRELLEALQKLTRAQAKLAMRMEEIDSKIEGGFADVGVRLDGVQGPPAPDQVDWGELLDALDLLQEAARQAEASPALAEGLAGVLARLDRFLRQVGLERRAAAGEAPDGRLFRVVGAESSPALPDGVVARVVRAAVLRGDEILREGEVIVTRRTA